MTKTYRALTLFLPALCVLFALTSCSPKLAAPEPTVEDLVSEARALYDAGKFYDAREKFEAIRFDYPGTPQIGEVQFYVGACYFGLGENLTAEQEFRSFLREFPADHAFAGKAMIFLCKSLFEQALPARLDQELTKKTIEETENFLETYPQSESRPEILEIKRQCLDRLAEKEFLAGQLYRRMGYGSSAIHYFRLLEAQYPDSRWIVRGRYEWAYSLYEQKSFADAKAMVDTCRARLNELTALSKDHFLRTDPYGKAYQFFHFYGLISYETRSEIKIFIDDLESDLSRLSVRIDRKLQKQAAGKKS